MIEATPLPGLNILRAQVFEDDRGSFAEMWSDRGLSVQGLHHDWCQENRSHSRRAGTLRGLHYQLEHPQGKLVRVVAGEVFDVAVDIRRGSPYFGQWVGVTLSAENRLQLYVPPGFAHGFCTLSARADFLYKCTDFYAPGDEYGIAWDDPDVGIDWPAMEYLLSDKDRDNPRLADSPSLPGYQAD